MRHHKILLLALIAVLYSSFNFYLHTRIEEAVQSSRETSPHQASEGGENTGLPCLFKNYPPAEHSDKRISNIFT